jgi:hypothetical protein
MVAQRRFAAALRVAAPTAHTALSEGRGEAPVASAIFARRLMAAEENKPFDLATTTRANNQ